MKIINYIMQEYSKSFDLCPQDKRVSGFQRFYHVTEPFIKRLGLEAELQVSDCVGFSRILSFV